MVKQIYYTSPQAPSAENKRVSSPTYLKLYLIWFVVKYFHCQTQTTVNLDICILERYFASNFVKLVLQTKRPLNGTLLSLHNQFLKLILLQNLEHNLNQTGMSNLDRVKKTSKHMTQSIFSLSCYYSHKSTTVTKCLLGNTHAGRS